MRIKRLLQSQEVAAVPQMAAIAVLVLLTVAAGAVVGTAHAESHTYAATESAPPPVPASDILVPIIVATHPLPTPPVTERLPQLPQTQNPGPVRVMADVLAQNIISKAQPVYPEAAKQACAQGAVVLHAIISATGDVKALQVVSGPEELYTSAIDAVRQWKYKPYLLNGEPTEVDTTITVNYHINNDRCPTAQNEPVEPSPILPKAIGGPVSAPVVLYAPQPEFPPEAREQKPFSGSQMWVGPDGVPSHVQVVRGYYYRLDESAIAAAKLYRFKPAMEDGKPVTVALNIEVRFTAR